jgi:ABC-type multidrug transport system permease subunit
MSAATPAAILAGKALAAGAVGFAISTVSLTVGRLVLSIPVANFPLAALWLTAAGLTAYCLMALLQMCASTRVGGDLVSSFFLFPLAMLGGSFFPLDTMPASIAAVGRASPVGWAVTRLQSIMSGTAARADLAVWFAVMGAAAGFCFLLAVVQMRRRFLPR